jgi:hypothetical protein
MQALRTSRRRPPSPPPKSNVLSVIFGFPATLDFSAWYAGIGVIGPLTALALAGYGFWVALAGQPIFRDELAGA